MSHHIINFAHFKMEHNFVCNSDITVFPYHLPFAKIVYYIATTLVLNGIENRGAKFRVALEMLYAVSIHNKIPFCF